MDSVRQSPQTDSLHFSKLSLIVCCRSCGRDVWTSLGDGWQHCLLQRTWEGKTSTATWTASVFVTSMSIPIGKLSNQFTHIENDITLQAIQQIYCHTSKFIYSFSKLWIKEGSSSSTTIGYHTNDCLDIIVLGLYILCLQYPLVIYKSFSPVQLNVTTIGMGMRHCMS